MLPLGNVSKLYASKKIYFCDSRSSLKMTNIMLIAKLIFLRNSKKLLLTTTMLKIFNQIIKIMYPYLNQLVRYQSKSIFIEEFYRVAFMAFIS